MVPPFLGSALCMSDFDESGVGTTCFPSAVPELRTSTLKQTVFILTRLRSRPLVFGMSFSCLPSLLERLHLQPALSPPLSPKNLWRTTVRLGQMSELGQKATWRP